MISHLFGMPSLSQSATGWHESGMPSGVHVIVVPTTPSISSAAPPRISHLFGMPSLSQSGTGWQLSGMPSGVHVIVVPTTP